MITKEQALEFIYDLSQKTEIMLDVECGEMQFHRIVDGDYLHTTFAEKCTLEETVLKCIKENMEAIECLGIKQIPIDTDMLEVGQTYNIKYLCWDEIKCLNDILLDIQEDISTHKKILIFNWTNVHEGHVKEIYKVIE